MITTLLILLSRYNTAEHPIAFHKAQDLGKLPKKLDGGPAPDHEDAYDVSRVIRLVAFDGCSRHRQHEDETPDAASDDDKRKKNPNDVANDKLIKAKKVKATKGMK